MKSITKLLTILGLLAGPFTEKATGQTGSDTTVTYRPQIHFTPEANWMNDPNGLVYYKGTYHLFYQYYPKGTQWGPMHWGHSTSKDLFHWQEQPIALYPDSLGYIFSGSAVVDSNNTSGLGSKGKIPLVAIFTHHNPKLEKEGKPAQSQGLAYSLDEGKTWEKYRNNPVLPNPGISDFRDPKVSWFAAGKKWIMTLATKDRVTFYSSTNLIKWSKESDFGADLGGHGGVWECPDLFPLTLKGKTHWVLLVSVNPGGPNGGSATQYFLGTFDGHRYKAADSSTRWLDHGTDNYAGVTFSNTRNRRIFIGWMSNWEYAGKVPTRAWRGATTLPRELSLAENGNSVVLTSEPVRELNQLVSPVPRTTLRKLQVRGLMPLSRLKVTAPFKLRLSGKVLKDFAITLKNGDGKRFVFGYNAFKNQYYTDRTLSGETSFNKEFPKIHYAPRISKGKAWQVELIIDAASAEIFADGGRNSFTDIFFSPQKLNHIVLSSKGKIVIDELSYLPLQSALKH